MRLYRWCATSEVEFVAQSSDLLLVVLLHFKLVLLKLVDLVANELHLLDLLSSVILILLRIPILVLELSAQ